MFIKGSFHLTITMTQFSVSKFAADPSAELSSIKYAKKAELLELARHVSLETRSSMRKSEILNLVLEHYMKKGIVGF